MRLNMIKGLDQAKGELTRISPLDLDSLPPELMDRTEELLGEAAIAPGVGPAHPPGRTKSRGTLQSENTRGFWTVLSWSDWRCPRMRSPGRPVMCPRHCGEPLELAARRIEDFPPGDHP